MAFPSDGSGQSEGWALSRLTVPFSRPRIGPTKPAEIVHDTAASHGEDIYLTIPPHETEFSTPAPALFSFWPFSLRLERIQCQEVVFVQQRNL